MGSIPIPGKSYFYALYSLYDLLTRVTLSSPLTFFIRFAP